MKADAVCIAGLTASGKTELAVNLARQYGQYGKAAIINTDAMQVYQGLRNITDQPNPDQQLHAIHRLYGFVPTDNRYNVARWVEDAENEVARCRQNGEIPIFCGGTGLYFQALTQGLNQVPNIPPDLRHKLTQHIDKVGTEQFYSETETLNPDEAQRVGKHNRHRLLRAREVLEATGKPLTHWWNLKKNPPLITNPLWIVMLPPIAELEEPIHKRAQKLVKEPALQEVRQLRKCKNIAPSVQKIIAVHELSQLLNKTITPQQAILQITTKTRQYARRQKTWFKNHLPNENNLILINTKNTSPLTLISKKLSQIKP
ncbi:MAG: tRNA (adenosine(37)-N6)-dimethylallyltransferase MiaA [Alphaproteobacteria bacterium]